MNQENYKLIGLMSGTSGDGLDIAYVDFSWNGHWNFELLASQTCAFPEDLGQRLANSHLLSGLELSILDVDFGRWMGEQVKEFCAKKSITPLAVASHGHTVFHQPEKGLSKQIGNGWSLHQASGFPVICDFRMLDVQLGGQGAPLVPIGDRLLFSEIDFCINLGGISNISMEKEGNRIAFDMSPFNLLLNAEANKLGFPFDRGGALAREGQLNEPLLQLLNQVPFYEMPYPKSLGREDLDRDFFPLLKESGLQPKDALRTLVEHLALQISKVIRSHSGSSHPSVLLTGGGAYNDFFVERLDEYLGKNWVHHKASPELIEFKEALVFAFLGVLRIRQEPNSLASVTGASKDSCGGVIYG